MLPSNRVLLKTRGKEPPTHREKTMKIKHLNIDLIIPACLAGLLAMMLVDMKLHTLSTMVGVLSAAIVVGVAANIGAEIINVRRRGDPVLPAVFMAITAAITTYGAFAGLWYWNVPALCMLPVPLALTVFFVSEAQRRPQPCL